MKIRKIDIPIYYGYLNVIIAEDEQDMISVGKSYNHKEDVSKYGAFSWSDYDKKGINNCYVVITKNVSNHLIAHEVVHLVNAIFLHIGCELDRINDEPQAYLTGWIFNEIEKFLVKCS